MANYSSNNLLKVSKLRMGGGKINRPILRVVLFLSLLLLLAFLKGFRDGKRTVQREQAYYTIRYNPDLFYNADSLLAYAEKAYLFEDPDALAITGTAAFLFSNDLAAQDSLTFVSTDEGAIMLLRAVELGSDDALWIITVLDHHGLWTHSLPDNMDKYRLK